MKTNLIPRWLRTSSQVALAIPMLGFFTQMLGSDYFKEYLADVLINVTESFGTAIIHVLVQTILYGTA
jgi:hypothetical protein